MQILFYTTLFTGYSHNHIHSFRLVIIIMKCGRLVKISRFSVKRSPHLKFRLLADSFCEELSSLLLPSCGFCKILSNYKKTTGFLQNTAN